MMLLKDLLMSLILCANSCLNKNKINAMKILYPYRIIFIITLLLFCDDIYGGSRKVFQLIEKHGIKYIDYLFHYAGLMGLLAFMKAISWSKMLFGGFLSIVGAFYPNKKERSEGEAHIEVSKFKLFIKGSIKFTLVVVGAILIIGSVLDGFNGKDKHYPTGYIGISYTLRNGSIIITNVEKNMPADNAGIRSGDEIIKINGITVKGINRFKVSSLIKGKVNSTVVLETKRGNIFNSYELNREYKFVE